MRVVHERTRGGRLFQTVGAAVQKAREPNDKLTLKYDLLTLKMTLDAIENDTIELAVLKNPDIDTDIVFPVLLEVTLAQDSSKCFRLKLQTPKSRRSSPSLKESMVFIIMFITGNMVVQTAVQ